MSSTRSPQAVASSSRASCSSLGSVIAHPLRSCGEGGLGICFSVNLCLLYRHAFSAVSTGTLLTPRLLPELRIEALRRHPLRSCGEGALDGDIEHRPFGCVLQSKALPVLPSHASRTFDQVHQSLTSSHQLRIEALRGRGGLGCILQRRQQGRAVVSDKVHGGAF